MKNRFLSGFRWTRLGIAAGSLLAFFAGSASAATLSGNLDHDGRGNGLYYIYVVRVGWGDWIAGTDVLTSPGRWEVRNVPDGTYFVFGWRDTNRNFFPSRGEPMGFHGITLPQGVIVSNNQDRRLVNVRLHPLDLGAELTGKIIYTGPLRGRIWVVPHLGPELSALNARGAPATLLAPGTYEAVVLESGEYYVTAWLDVNGNMLWDQGEPSGSTGPRIIEVTPGVTYYGVDITLQTRTTAVSERSWTQIKSLYD